MFAGLFLGQKYFKIEIKDIDKLTLGKHLKYFFVSDCWDFTYPIISWSLFVILPVFIRFSSIIWCL